MPGRWEREAARGHQWEPKPSRAKASVARAARRDGLEMRLGSGIRRVIGVYYEKTTITIGVRMRYGIIEKLFVTDSRISSIFTPHIRVEMCGRCQGFHVGQQQLLRGDMMGYTSCITSCSRRTELVEITNMDWSVSLSVATVLR